MITKLTLDCVASFKKPAILETDKKVNLIYGLNGTGKSTLSNFLYKLDDEKHQKCSVEGLDDTQKILVYNQKFIQDHFFEPDRLKGIFTLNRKNKAAEIGIAAAEEEIKRIGLEKTKNEEESLQFNKEFNQAKEIFKNTIWKIKTDYSGGDRVLEFCLEGYKASKDALFNHIVNLAKPDSKPNRSIEELKDTLQSISGDNDQEYSTLPSFIFPIEVEKVENLLDKQIVGNENSSVAELINKLNNPDWVKDGLKFLPATLAQDGEVCPFCQAKTITQQLLTRFKEYFDASYEEDLNALKSLLVRYLQLVDQLPVKSIFDSHPKSVSFRDAFDHRYREFITIVDNNKKLIEEKIEKPSVPMKLKNFSLPLEELNSAIHEINEGIVTHNNNVKNKNALKARIKDAFWAAMRWDYDNTISKYQEDKLNHTNKEAQTRNLFEKLKKDYEDQLKKINEFQKQTVNIKDAIENVNNGLIELGIDTFKIINYSKNLYKIVREENDDSVFHSLSEGEKMIISFLYFIEVCKGKTVETELTKRKIIVIDDPISSLSHIYVFNVGRLIHREFLRSDKYEQFFLLTHSLYFFYELADINYERRKKNQKLFRIQKNNAGSEITEMSYEEIQNDYHAYWYVVKDELQPPALIANCMRNIIEYFFSFVEKKDLNGVFQKQCMQETRFEAFCRYVNRESHSVGQNIFDIKEFNYVDFKDAFALVFKENGYEEHYKKMMKD